MRGTYTAANRIVSRGLEQNKQTVSNNLAALTTLVQVSGADSLFLRPSADRHNRVSVTNRAKEHQFDDAQMFTGVVFIERSHLAVCRG